MGVCVGPSPRLFTDPWGTGSTQLCIVTGSVKPGRTRKNVLTPLRTTVQILTSLTRHTVHVYIEKFI